MRNLVAVGLLFSILVLGGVVYVVVDTQEKNKEAIEKGCILLNNAIVQSQNNPTSGVLIREILTNAREDGRGDVIIEFRRASKGGTGGLKPVNCDRVADHPEDIVAIPVKAP